MKYRPDYGPYLYAHVRKRKGRWLIEVASSSGMLNANLYQYSTETYEECVAATAALLALSKSILMDQMGIR